MERSVKLLLALAIFVILVLSTIAGALAQAEFSILPKPPIERTFIYTPFRQVNQTMPFEIRTNRVLTRCQADKIDAHCVIFNGTMAQLQMDFSDDTMFHQTKMANILLTDQALDTYNFTFTVEAYNLAYAYEISDPGLGIQNDYLFKMQDGKIVGIRLIVWILAFLLLLATASVLRGVGMI